MKIRLLVFFIFLSSAIRAQEEDKDFRQIYLQAEEEYNIGHFDNSILLLNKNLNLFNGTLKASAYRLITLCYLEQDNIAEAEKNVSMLLKIDPYYSVSIHDPLRFVDMVEQFKKGEATITTASQQAETVDEVPVPVTLITEEMIKVSGARNLCDLLLLYVPGMSSIEGKDMNIAMHGVYSSLQEKILVMLNGHRLNSRATNSESLDYRTSLDKIKQIEVLRGPASSLYGNVALTAVVNIITKQGRDADGAKLTVGAGDNQTYRADFTMGKSGLVTDFMLWASLYSSQGEKRNIGIEDPDFYGSILQPGSMYIGGYNHQPSYDIGFIGKWNDFKFLFNTQYSKKVTAYNTVLFPSLYSYDKYRTVNGSTPGNARQATHMELTYEKSWGKLSGKVNAFVDMENCSNYDVGGDSLSDLRLDLVYPGEIIENWHCYVFSKGFYQVQSWDDYTYGGTAQMNYAFEWKKMKGTLLAGLQFENYVMKDNSMMVGDRFDRILFTLSDQNKAMDLGNEMNISGFVQVKSNLGTHLIFNGGARYDYKRRFDSRNLNAFSPRLSLIWKINPRTNLKVGYSHSFVDAPYFYRATTIATYSGGRSLDFETMDALLVDFSWNIPQLNLKYEANIYYNQLNDLIFCDMSKYEDMYSNAGSLKIMGLENTFTYQSDRVTSHLNLTYQHLLSYNNYTARTGNINNVPNFTMNGSFSYMALKSKQIGNVRLFVNANLSTKQYSPLIDPYIRRGEQIINDSEKKIGARIIVNNGIIYNYNRWRLSANIYNLFNTDYHTGDSRMPVPQQGRSFMTILSYSF